MEGPPCPACASEIGRASCRERGLVSDWSSDVCSSDLDITAVKEQVLHKKIVCDKRILPELHFNGHAVLDEVSLFVRPNRFADTLVLQVRPLFREWKVHHVLHVLPRSEERRVGKEGWSVTGVQTCALPILTSPL